MQDTSPKYEKLTWYPAKEEKLNIYSHMLGIVLAVIATLFLVIKSTSYPWVQGASLILFGISQILIFSASTIYHSQTQAPQRNFYNIIDHAMIYVSIAGTYSPICLISLQNNGGIFLFCFVWLIALVGMLLKIKFTGRYNILSTLMYMAMGWIIVFYWHDINAHMDTTGVNLIIIGGVSYTIGAILFMIDKIPYNHAMFHLFILIGAASHFSTIYFYT